MEKLVNKAIKIHGSITTPPDKSISHRAIMLSALSNGISIIKNFSKGQDPLSTLKIFNSLGINHKFIDESTLEISSNGILVKPTSPLDCGNSGTTMRLLSGILAGQKFDSILIGDNSLSKRPMLRVIEPLRLMGAQITANENHAPLVIKASRLHSINYTSKISSAQVKSAILLAGLYTDGKTVFKEPCQSRNHTELMLKYLDANIESIDSATTAISFSQLTPKTIVIPGDISSAAYFIAAALIVPNSELIIKNVGLNPTRTGFLDVCKMMGADIEILDKKTISGELSGDIRVKYSSLRATTICGEIIPRLIDELPIIAVLATQAKGETIVKDAGDLRNKESDRIKSIVNGLSSLGANIVETQDGFIIQGKTKLKGDCLVETQKDHRLIMSLFVAGLVCEKPIFVKDFEWVKISMPEFEKLMETVIS